MKRPVSWILQRALFTDSYICVCEPALYQRAGIMDVKEAAREIKKYITNIQNDFRVFSDVQISGNNVILIISKTASVEDFLKFRKICVDTYSEKKNSTLIDFNEFIFPAFMRRYLNSVYPDELSDVSESIIKRAFLDMSSFACDATDFYWREYWRRVKIYAELLEKIFEL